MSTPMAGHQQCQTPTLLTGLAAYQSAWHTHVADISPALTCISSPHCPCAVPQSMNACRASSPKGTLNQRPQLNPSRYESTRDRQQSSETPVDVKRAHIHTCPPHPSHFPLSIPSRAASSIHPPATSPSKLSPSTSSGKFSTNTSPSSSNPPSTAHCPGTVLHTLARVHWLMNTLFAL